MKKLYYLVNTISILLSGCGKQNASLTIQHKSLKADAGPDVVISMPQTGTGFVFKAILDGRGSYDESGKIVFYSWAEISGFGSNYSTRIDFPNADSTDVTLFRGKHKFRLEIQNEKHDVDYDTVTISVNQRFSYEYNNLSWDSTVSLFTYLNINYKPGLIETFPGFTPDYVKIKTFVNLCTSGGNCENAGDWRELPYVPYDSIKQTEQNLFYSSNDNENFLTGMGWVVVYAKPESGIDFTKKVALGLMQLSN